MADELLWEMGEHTIGKHLVLRAYLAAWFPILGSWAGRILFIDGFAGPGEYSGGQEGSPLIAISALRDHSAKRIVKAEVGFLFIEADPARAAHLRSLLASRAVDVSPKFWWTVEEGTFDTSMTEALDYLEKQKKDLAPSFVMIDPFGVSDTPMSLISRILENKRTEIYVSFMWEFINRFKKTPEFEKHLDALFGCPEWRASLAIANTEDRKRYLHDLYRAQLKAAGARFVLEFELFRGSRHVYTLFFATDHPLGCDRMKQAMWKVAPLGDYAFYGRASGQASLIQLGFLQPNLGPLRAQLTERFGGKGWVTVDDVLAFVRSDETAFHSGQLKTGVLKGMEEDGAVEVDPSSRKKARTFPEGCLLRFSAKA